MSLHRYDDMPHGFFSFVNIFQTGNRRGRARRGRGARADRGRVAPARRVPAIATIGVYGFDAASFLAALAAADVRVAARRAPAPRGARRPSTRGRTRAASRTRWPTPGSPTATISSSRRRPSSAASSTPRTTGSGSASARARSSRPSTPSATRARSSRAPTSTRSSPGCRARERRCCSASSATPRPATGRSPPSASPRGPAGRSRTSCPPTDPRRHPSSASSTPLRSPGAAPTKNPGLRSAR